MACFPEVSFHAATKTTTVCNETMFSLHTMPTCFVTVRTEPSDITSYNKKLLSFFTFFLVVDQFQTKLISHLNVLFSQKKFDNLNDAYFIQFFH